MFHIRALAVCQKWSNLPLHAWRTRDALNRLFRELSQRRPYRRVVVESKFPNGPTGHRSFGTWNANHLCLLNVVLLHSNKLQIFRYLKCKSSFFLNIVLLHSNKLESSNDSPLFGFLMAFSFPKIFCSEQNGSHWKLEQKNGSYFD